MLVNSNKKSLNITRRVFFVCTAIASLIIGLRWNMGVDFENYYTVISTPIHANIHIERFELIPRYLIVLIQYFDLPYCTWFITMAFFHFIFLYLAANNGLKFLLPWMLFFYFYSLFDLSLNITRQTAAITVILYAYTFINRKNLRAYLLLIAVAYCFHRTALICIPLYWIAPRVELNNRFIQTIIVCSCIVAGSVLKNYLWESVQALESLRYAHYADADFDYGNSGTGLGVIANYIRYFILIYYSNILKKVYKGQGFHIFYFFVFVDMCLYNSLKDDLALSRIEMYFSSANIITTGFLCHYLSRSRRAFDRIIYIMLLLMFLTIMVYTAYNGIAWSFVI